MQPQMTDGDGPDLEMEYHPYTGFGDAGGPLLCECTVLSCFHEASTVAGRYGKKRYTALRHRPRSKTLVLLPTVQEKKKKRTFVVPYFSLVLPPFLFN